MLGVFSTTEEAHIFIQRMKDLDAAPIHGKDE
jgi:hypothetical protein